MRPCVCKAEKAGNAASQVQERVQLDSALVFAEPRPGEQRKDSSIVVESNAYAACCNSTPKSSLA